MKTVAIRRLFVTSLALAALGWQSASAFAQTNLLTVNPSFEQGGVAPNHNNGTYNNVLAGWNFREDSYSGNQMNISTGDGTEGVRFFRMNHGGLLETAPTARPSVTPGKVYELKFDSKKTRDEKPGSWRGMFPFIDFYNASGTRIKQVRGGEFQHTGTTGWEVLKMRATAPATAVRVGIRVFHSVGVLSEDASQTDVNLRDFRVDNFRLQEVAETSSKVYLRNAPRLLEKGKVVPVKFRYTAVGPRRVIVRLMDGSGATLLTQTRDITVPGRGLQTLSFTVPTSLTTGSNYKWVARIFTPGAVWEDSFLSQSDISGVIHDDSVVGSGIAYADNPKLVYQGRLMRGGTGTSSYANMYWGGTQIRARFNGTSIVFTGTGSQDYLGNAANMIAIIDGDDANGIRFRVPPGTQEITLKTGLSDGIHSVVIYKNSDLEQKVVFKSFKLDPGKGLLSPEPLSNRRIEFYGDSVTDGASPDPRVANPDPNDDGDWLGNAAHTYTFLTANELGMDARVIAKGGMGIQAGFVPYHLEDKWDRLDGPGTIPNDFSTWQPQAVVLAIGHNDQFSNQGGTANTSEFIRLYREQIQKFRDVYPNAHIFCMNTSITQGDFSSWEKSVVPLLNVGNDPKLHFQLYPWQNHGGHPRIFDMQGMATGNERYFSLSDWIENTLIGIGADGGDGKTTGGPSANDVGAAFSPAPFGATISVKAANNTNFLTTDLSLPSSIVRAAATGVGNWEQFRVVDAGNGQVALYSVNTNRYISVDGNQRNRLLRSDLALQVLNWERFVWEPINGNKFAFKSATTGRYVTANLLANGDLMASSATTIGPNEQFEWQRL